MLKFSSFKLVKFPLTNNLSNDFILSMKVDRLNDNFLKSQRLACPFARVCKSTSYKFTFIKSRFWILGFFIKAIPSSKVKSEFKQVLY